DASTRALLVMALPTPTRPPSVSTSTTVLMLSSGVSSSAQPPSTVPPERPVRRTSTIFIGVTPLSLADRALAPGDRHRRRRAVPVTAASLGPVLDPGHDPHQLLARLPVGLLALLRRRQFRVAEHAGLGVAARPGDHRRRARREQVHPVERAVLLVE